MTQYQSNFNTHTEADIQMSAAPLKVVQLGGPFLMTLSLHRTWTNPFFWNATIKK
jgi:hypothetical protein